MNKQYKGPGRRGIGWTDYTHNPIGGCFHRCRWKMPDGQIAECYAGEVATGLGSGAYPQGFEHHYWRPKRLDDPIGQKTPSKIFIDSMSDLFGHWVPDDQVRQVLSACRAAHWHEFQVLTKNPKRLLSFDLSGNFWIGISSPPDFFMGKELTQDQKERMLRVGLATLAQVEAKVRWISIEPLSWDISQIILETRDQFDFTLDWAVVGAASAGRIKYQPDPETFNRVVAALDETRTPVFYKDNLSKKLVGEWREEFPACYTPYQKPEQITSAVSFSL